MGQGSVLGALSEDKRQLSGYHGGYGSESEDFQETATVCQRARRQQQKQSPSGFQGVRGVDKVTGSCSGLTCPENGATAASSRRHRGAMSTSGAMWS
eukprot:3869121-Amphidinium_carterae.1